jgi:predicted amidohydrolase YtcJ
MVSPEVLERAAAANVIWSLQPPQFYRKYAAAISRVYGEEYAHQWVMPVKSLMDAGMRVTYGADVHDDPERQPMFNLEVLVTRRISDGRVFGPREVIDRESALLMMTRWGAEYVLKENEIGSLEPGKYADLVILAQNPLDPNIPDQDLSEIKVLTTLIDGEVRYGSLGN